MKRMKFNHPAIWVCIILTQVLPVVWYSIIQQPIMSFNELLTRYYEANETSWLFITSILGGVLAMYVLAWLYRELKVDSGREGLITGLILGFALNMISLYNINMFSDQPIDLAIIDGGANTMVYGVAGFILGAWRIYEAEKE